MKVVTLTKEEFIKKAYESNPQLDEQYAKIAKELNEQAKQTVVLEPLRFTSKSNIPFKLDMNLCKYK